MCSPLNGPPRLLGYPTESMIAGSLGKSTCQVALIYTAPQIFMKHARTPHACVEAPAL